MSAEGKQTMKDNFLVALAGQQNAGKSTTYNMITGANQHVANYPGVTVDKKVGSYREGKTRYEVVDLPGTYSLTSFSLEERVSREFLLEEKPDVVVNVMDATCLRRSLYFTFQVLEMNFPVTVALNMMDVAESQGLTIDLKELTNRLGVDVVATVGRKGKGKQALKAAIRKAVNQEAYSRPVVIDYGDLEIHAKALEEQLAADTSLGVLYPLRWLAIKLLENDSEARSIVETKHANGSPIIEDALSRRMAFEDETGVDTSDYIVACRDRVAGEIVDACVTKEEDSGQPISERIDQWVLNRALAPFFLLATVYLIYELSIVQGYELTKYTWPFLAKFRDLVASILPPAGLIEDSLLRSMILWMVDSANTLLNYVPIFLILFALIAILEDSGYMARIAFILDRIFHSFGLHGQSTLPFILGGVFAGGCAVPGIMSTKGIPDERSRLATILTVPFMNCLAKIPLYTLLVNIYFAEHKSWAMFFISTITIIMALIIAKLLTTTVLKGRETAPFIMEMPNYHAPTFFGVARRSLERTWEYIKKVGSIVVAVSLCVFSLLQFPGLSAERMDHYEAEMNKAIATYDSKVANNAYAELATGDKMLPLLNLYDDYKRARMNASGKEGAARVDSSFKNANPDTFILIKPRGDKAAKVVNRALRKVSTARKSLRRMIKEEKIKTSFFGMIGRSLEPVTKYAGFDWKINIALISSFAARESSVATMGVLYQQGADDNQTLEQRMDNESQHSGMNSLHALAVILFFALYPPCLAATIMVKVQTGSYKWMLFAIFFPTAVGFGVASSVFTLGTALGASGITMMKGFYALALAVALLIALVHKIASDKVSASYEYQPSNQ
ncbi:ferrous iron transport protein B [Maridesulfovibrio salexigens]|uniref:Ferrous iron transport protein B n=1 Tax=Maridesulfovibrio salexigens (strain ATCC 14822 / DSM 2638 / NCIMB 8403 / VKM B-1763) TaxID=526222 RepID=C6BVG9_MARSD|nr:ferrous iron transport protein B [Maridesulfovibrio salexigens]ACS78183.1 small GTP-binding protein [Maridesulfovibrio salexigens DSM 2638]